MNEFKFYKNQYIHIEFMIMTLKIKEIIFFLYYIHALKENGYRKEYLKKGGS